MPALEIRVPAVRFRSWPPGYRGPNLPGSQTSPGGNPAFRLHTVIRKTRLRVHPVLPLSGRDYPRQDRLADRHISCASCAAVFQDFLPAQGLPTGYRLPPTTDRNMYACLPREAGRPA